MQGAFDQLVVFLVDHGPHLVGEGLGGGQRAISRVGLDDERLGAVVALTIGAEHVQLALQAAVGQGLGVQLEAGPGQPFQSDLDAAALAVVDIVHNLGDLGSHAAVST